VTQLKKGTMIYQLRIYHSMPGRLPALLARFQNHTLRIWEKYGIRQAGLLMLAMQILVLVMLWALAVVMTQMVGRAGMAQKVGKVGKVGRVGMAARKSGCYLTAEREFLHRG